MTPKPGVHETGSSPYIAASRTLGAGQYKVGLSRHPGTRRDALNAQAYGGVNDWWMAHYKPVSSMRAVEAKLHECFGPPVPTETGSEVEVFSVPYPKAREYLDLFAELFRPQYPVGQPF